MKAVKRINSTILQSYFKEIKQCKLQGKEIQK